MGSYSCVLFDLDGTLMDTSSGIMRATDHIIKRFHLPDISEERKRGFIGPPIQKSFQEQYGFDQERAWELATIWREVYKEEFLLDAVPYDGIYDLLQHMREKGIKTCVATNKREDYAVKLLSKFSFTPLFDCVVGSDFEGIRNKSDIIRICMKRVGAADPTRCLMIGDTIGDMVAAKETGVDFLGVTYGFGFSENLIEKEMAFVNNCEEIRAMVKNWKPDEEKC